MLSQDQIVKNKERIITILSNIDRKGMDDLIRFLSEDKFYIQPASTKYHQNYEGGLAEHSLEVYDALCKLNNLLNLGISLDSIAIVAILHDLCKINAYIKRDDNTFTYNPHCDPGHALKSLALVSCFIDLTEEEIAGIKYHMGAYEKKEYNWNELGEAYKTHKIAYFTHVADMFSTYGY